MREKMANAAQPLTAAERAQRSVFVGNIPYEATEEQLKEIFLQAGPVVSFRLVYDRETGKPKGYGFCEYQDVETAQSAMRNLNNHDFNGRPLRVGVAAGEQNKDEIKSMQQALGGPPVESPYGEPVESQKAPEAISKAVASLPPEQMFELMKQMKLCINNNPNEARNMLLQNPQLAYALLQAQIVMKIVDPNVALAMLHRKPDQIPPLLPSNEGQKGPDPMSLGIPSRSMPQSGGGHPAPMAAGGRGPPASGPPPQSSNYSSEGRGPMGGPPLDRGRGPMGPGPGGPPMGGHSGPPMDHRGPGRPGDMGGPQRGPPGMLDRGPMSGPGGSRPGGMGGPPQHDMPSRGGPGPQRGEMRDPRMDRVDPRQGRGPPPGPAPGGPGRGPGGPAVGSGGIPGLGNLTAGGAGGGGQDQEKAQLIMQVLQLTDQQIAMLPAEQRQSILILKDQIQRSGGMP